jgi:uncharacterized phage protein gp47/JayE
MADLPRPDEFARIAQGVYRTALDPGGTGAVNLRSGSRNDALVSLFTALSIRLAAYAADRASGAHLSSAEDEDLDVLGRDLFQEERKEAIGAVGTVYLKRTGVSATSIPKGSRVGVPAAPGQPAVQFQATDEVTAFVVDGPLVKARIAVQAVQPGIIGNVTLAAITAILDPLPDTGWSLYVPSGGDVIVDGAVDVIGGGAEREDNDTYRARLRQLATDASRQRGTRAAILKGALRVAGVGFATVVEPQDGTVVVYVGDAAFALPSALKSAVETELLDWRAFGVPALVRRYNAVDVTITGTLYMARAIANYDRGALKAAAIARVLEYFDNRPNPDEYFVNRIESAILRAHDEAQDVVLTLPAASVLRPLDSGYGAITALNRYRLTSANINLTIAGPRTT